MKKNPTLIAIERASSIIQYASWAMNEEDPKRKLEWIKEAMYFCDLTKQWLEKELPF